MDRPFEKQSQLSENIIPYSYLSLSCLCLRTDDPRIVPHVKLPTTLLPCGFTWGFGLIAMAVHFSCANICSLIFLGFIVLP